MKLSTVWLNPTRPHDEKVRVEQTYKETLLDFFGGVELAKRARDIHRKRQMPADDWERANKFASIAISKLLSPTEHSQAKFIVEFN